MIIRGICCLKPKIDGVSETISVHSIIGKYLEHPRVYYFKHDSAKCYISSADLMPRNLVRRVELMTPIENDKFSSKIESILLLQIADNQLRWKLQPTGEYKKILAKKRKINNQEMIARGKITIKKRKKIPKYIDDLADQIIQGE